MSPKLLVIDDDQAGCKLLQAIFRYEGFEVTVCHDGATGLAHVASQVPDVVILDLRLPGMNGLDVLVKLRELNRELPVVLLTAHGEVKSAVRATQLGAFDYLTKPIDQDEIVVVIRRAAETGALRSEVERLRKQVKDDGLATCMGSSAKIEQVIKQVRMVASSSFSVLILGETGTGKELVAQAVHRTSERHRRPFVALDCGAIPEALLESELFGHEKGAFTGADRKKKGRFQQAEGGSLFLDEVGNLPMSLQAKLLRVLESRQVQAVGATSPETTDVRFVAATNDDLPQRVHEGKFRADLYFRLAQYTIALPPLRERVEDIAYLAHRFLNEASVELRRPVQQIAPDALQALASYGWPGNVRELRNVMRQAVLESNDLVLQGSVVRRLLGKPKPNASPTSPNSEVRSLREVAQQAAREAERQAICEILRSTHGNKSEAARMLQTDYKTLHTKLKTLGIRRDDFSS